MAFTLTVVEPTTSTRHELTSLSLQTPVGNITILEGHSPTLIQLSSQQEIHGEKADGSDFRLQVTDGVAKVERDTVLLIVTY